MQIDTKQESQVSFEEGAELSFENEGKEGGKKDESSLSPSLPSPSPFTSLNPQPSRSKRRGLLTFSKTRGPTLTLSERFSPTGAAVGVVVEAIRTNDDGLR